MLANHSSSGGTSASCSTLKLEKGCLFFLGGKIGPSRAYSQLCTPEKSYFCSRTSPIPLSRRVGKTTLAAPGLDPERQRAPPQPVRGGCEPTAAGPLRRP